MKAPAIKITAVLLMCAAALLTTACTNQGEPIPFNLEMEARKYRATQAQQPVNEYRTLIDAYARCHGRYSKEEQKKRAINADRRIREHPDNAAVIRHQIRAECLLTPMPEPTAATQESIPEPTDPSTPATSR